MKVRSLSKHRDDIVNDNRMMSIGIIGFPKTQINPSGSTGINNKMSMVNVFNNSKKKEILVIILRVTE